jgi:acetyl esterase/lipase
MNPTRWLACAAFSTSIAALHGAQGVQAIPLLPGSAVTAGPSDYDPRKLDKDRFAGGSELDTPQLTYFPAPPSGAPLASVIICPGGSYMGERVDKEGFQPALWFNSLGISAFVLRYRLPHGEAGKGLVPPPLEDIRRAIVLVRGNAQEWGLDPKRIGVMGWSAGGHLAASAGTLFHEREKGTSDRPDFLVLMYPVITMGAATHKDSRMNLLGSSPSESVIRLYSADEQVTSRTPPTFIAVARDDTGVPLENSILFAHALKAVGVPCELDIYEHGGHGFGMGEPGTDSMLWPKAFAVWAGKQSLLESRGK